MRIDVSGDDSISRQARTYAEYRLFAALSAVVNTSQIRRASLALRPAKSRRGGDAVLCTVTVALNDGDATCLRAWGDHPYAAINRAVERLRSKGWPGRHDSAPSEMALAK